jgi:GNAT superfamily N-acetyltransferase
MEIREAREDDAAVLAELLGELGYPTEAADLPQRLERLAAEAGAGVMVAVSGGAGGATAAGEPIGVLAFAEFQPLERPAPTCRILTLVVSSRHRREGVAGALLGAVESRARERGCDRLEVTTQPKREAALALYLDAGYAEKPRRLLRMLAG